MDLGWALLLAVLLLATPQAAVGQIPGRAFRSVVPHPMARENGATDEAQPRQQESFVRQKPQPFRPEFRAAPIPAVAAGRAEVPAAATDDLFPPAGAEFVHAPLRNSTAPRRGDAAPVLPAKGESPQ